MRAFLRFVPFACAAILSAQTLDMTELKQMEVDRLRTMAAAGTIPRARLEQAQAELEDAADNSVLRRSLYGTIRIEDLTKEQSEQMVEAATRLVDRQQQRLDKARALVDSGILARNALSTLSDDLHFREKTLDLAKFRAKLLDELASQAHAEEQLEASGPVQYRLGGAVERFDGRTAFKDLDFVRLASAFQRQFGKILPVSAKGETALHRSLGFDHRGRVDVALNPDQREGVWLRNYLKSTGIPYFAFRAAVRGSATGAHIHLGPPSMRYRIAD